MMRKWIVKIKPISPIHIGDGEISDPTEYIAKNGFVYYLNQTTFISDLLQSGCKDLKLALDKMDLESIVQVLEGNFDEKNRHHWVSKTEVNESFCNLWKNNLGNYQKSQQLHKFIRNNLNGQPYIPGSSIKGSIRTAILSLLTDDSTKIQEINSLRKTDKSSAQTAEAILLNARNRSGRMDVSADPFKYVKVSDAIIPEGSLFIDKILRCKMTKQELPVFYEMIKEESDEFSFSFQVDQRFEKTCSRVFFAINRFYKHLMKIELDWIKANIPDSLNYRNIMVDKANSLNNSDNRCIIRLGFGCGQRSFSLEPFWKKKLKTKAFWNGKLLGWAELHFEELK